MLVLPGGAQLDQARFDAIASAGILLIGVSGDVHASIAASMYARYPKLLVMGDLHMPCLHASIGFGQEGPVQVLGTIHCQHHVYCGADDGESSWRSTWGRVEAPLAFLWQVQDRAPLQFSPATVVFVAGDDEQAQVLAQQADHPVVLGHAQAIHALRDELYDVPTWLGDNLIA